MIDAAQVAGGKGVAKIVQPGITSLDCLERQLSREGEEGCMHRAIVAAPPSRIDEKW